MRLVSLVGLGAPGLIAALLLGCGSEDTAGPAPAPPPEPARPSSVSITLTTAVLSAFGDTVRLQAEVRDQNGRAMAGAAVTWASGDASIATVDASGLVTAAGGGTATITATAGSASGTAMVTVAQQVSAVAVAPGAEALVAGDTLRLTATATDANGHPVAGAEFSWASSDSAVAAVDSTGLVTAAGAGETTVTATSGTVSASTSVTVMQTASTVAISPARATLLVGDTLRLTATATDANGHPVAGAEFSWASSDSVVAAVDSFGLVRGVAEGVAAITAALGSAEETAEIVVEADPDRAALVAFYNATDGPYWADNENWLTDAPLGEWYGVDTDASGRVIRLDLAGRFDYEAQAVTLHGLKGTIPPELGSLTQLRRLNLAINDLTGTIPAEFGGLTNLNYLGLSGNKLSGSIPPELGSLANLTSLWIHGNELSGPIPAELGGLTNLNSLNFNGNDLTGPIPAELGSLTNLNYLGLSGNELSGPIPAELGSLANLTQLWIKSNELSGPIPAEFGGLTNLYYLDLSRNELSGPMPPELGGLANLTRLWIFSNELSGPIPAELGDLANLTLLNLGGNNLSGPIPPELGDLANLEELLLWRTNLSGTIPSSFLDLANLKTLNLYEIQDLCAPGTAEFRHWLEGIEDYQDARYCSESDRAVLELVHEASAGAGWTDSEGWLGGPILGEWRGVRADSLGRVAALDLADNGLSGRLPANLGELDRMTELGIGGNPDLGGRLPASLVRLSLRSLDYADTGLCAPVETSFGEWLAAIPSHRGTGVVCAPLSDRAVLEALYHTTGGPNWANSENWLTDAPLAEWYGVDTDAAGRVVGLDLAGGWNHRAQAWIRHGLNGPIPPELGDLANLTRLSLASNSLTGPIPPELGNLANLMDLNLDSNDLTGPIPAELGDLANLTRLSLASNSLMGQIPPDLGNLANLEDLSLSGNDLSGPIPPQLGRLTSLTRLWLNWNNLTGAIPSELGELANLTYLYLGRNSLSGSAPAELGRLISLTKLHLGDNRLTGAIPSELGDLTNLTDLNLNGNDLSGPIPPELGRLTKLTSMNFNQNVLSGPIPAELGTQLAYLRSLNLGSNRLTGAIPVEFGRLSRLTRLYLGENDLSGTVPFEFGGLAALRELVLSANQELAGPLPTSLASLRNLELLSAGGTMLCAPSDAAFLGWLEAIPNQRVPRCDAQNTAAYLVQAVQSREFPVSIVASEEALLRVFPTAARARGAAMPAIRARFYAGGRETHVENIPGKSVPIPTGVDAGSLAKSANAVIPRRVMQPGLEMVIEVDPEGTLDPGLGVARRIPETGRMSVDVRAMPVLDLTLIPFLWTADPDSAVVDSVSVMTSDSKGAELLWGVRTLLPVSDLEVTAHEPVLSSSNNAYDLLAQTEALRVLEGGAGHYMGVLTGTVTGAGGVAYRSGRSTFVASGPNWFVIAHELGHNMSLGHAGCAADNDPAYPHADGMIGAWGYDFRAGTLVSPTRGDIMSYCGGNWISDYYFDKALRYRLADEGTLGAANVATTASLLLWGRVDAEGQPYLEPAFVVDAPPALPDSIGEYTIAGHAADGGELFSLSFAMPETADGDGSSGFVFALPVRPGWDENLAAITLSGPGGSVTLDGGSDFPAVILRDPQTRRIRGILREPPGTFGTLAEAVAALSPDPGLEVLFSRGIPDAQAWGRQERE